MTPETEKKVIKSTRPLLVGIFAALALVAVLCTSYIGLLRKTVSK